MHGMIDNLEVRVVGPDIVAADDTDSNSTRIDMTGYESVMFIATITDSVADGVATLTIQENDADSDTGMAAAEDAVATATCAVGDDLNGRALVVEYRNTGKRYVQATRASATADIAFGTVVAILKPYSRPAVQGATVADSAYVFN
jgi:hypothetical protein